MWRASCARAIRAEPLPGRAPTIQPAGSARTAEALTSPGSVTRGASGPRRPAEAPAGNEHAAATAAAAMRRVRTVTIITVDGRQPRPIP